MLKSVTFPAIVSILLLMAIPVQGSVPSQQVSTAPSFEGIMSQTGESTLPSTTPQDYRNHTGSGIVGVNVSGKGYVQTQNTTIYLWASTQTVFTVEFNLKTASEYETFTLCLNTSVDSSNTTPGRCTEITTIGTAVKYRDVTYHGKSDSYVIDFTFDQWPSQNRAKQKLQITFSGWEDTNETQLDTLLLSIQVVQRNGDLDNDNLPNQREVQLNTSLWDSDSDDDGLFDGVEVDEYGTDPLSPDTDGDGVRDAVEIQQGTDPTAPNVEQAIRTTNNSSQTSDSDDNQLAESQPVTLFLPPIVFGFLLVGITLIGIISLAWFRRTHSGLLIGQTPSAESSRPDSKTNTEENGEYQGHEANKDVILTDEERIIRVLEQQGGRAKQKEIVDETGWSQAKTSRLLAEMEANDEITKVRIGRENLVCTKGNEPSAASTVK